MSIFLGTSIPVVSVYLIVAIIWKLFNKSEAKRAISLAERAESHRYDKTGNLLDRPNTYLDRALKFYTKHGYWYKWPLYILKLERESTKKIKETLNQHSADVLLRQLDQIVLDKQKQNETAKKAEVARKKFDLLKKEMV